MSVLEQCKNQCGFFANKGLDGYCSKCAKDQPNVRSDVEIIDITDITNETNLPVQSLNTESCHKKRCASCYKKLQLALTFTCKCGLTLCSIHRYPESHECTYDFKQEQRKNLEKSNPKIVASKIDHF